MPILNYCIRGVRAATAETPRMVQMKKTSGAFYVDDFEVSGSLPDASAVLSHLLSIFGGQQEESYQMSEFLGIERVPMGVSSEGVASLLIHQSKYALYVVEGYEKRHNGGRRLRAIATRTRRARRSRGATSTT